MSAFQKSPRKCRISPCEMFQLYIILLNTILPKYYFIVVVAAPNKHILS